LVGRSWILGVDIPPSAYSVRGSRVNFDSSVFVDILTMWTFGEYGSYIGLDDLARIFGIPGKRQEFSGKDFHKYWFGSADERQLAIEYLERDVRVTAKLAELMGVNWLEL
jgi:hypothetical protein